ncbi:unnamed protein product [Calypogeia fissa]
MGMEQDMNLEYQDDGVVEAMPVDYLLADGSKDYKGRIARRDSTGGWRTGPLVFGPETCEKMAVASIVVNIVPYFTNMLHLTSSYSANTVTTYQGTSYMLTLLGGFAADAMLGRFCVIVIASVVQFLGLLLITLSAGLPVFEPKKCLDTDPNFCPPQTGTPLIIIYTSLYMIAVGTGGIKACASAFGADQFDPHHDKEKKNLAGFFSWYFFGITCGAFVAVTILVWIQDNVDRFWGYLIPTITMLCVVAAFVSGRSLYRYKGPQGSPLTQILQVFVAAYRKRNLQLPDDKDSDLLFELDSKSQPYGHMKLKRTNQFKCLDKAAIMVDSKLETENKWRLNTVTSVEETKMVIRLIPILATTSLFYTVYAQTTTFSVEQGLTMERKIGNFEFSAASMAAFLQASILLTLFFWEKAVVPIARRFTGCEKGTTSLQRIGIGLVISIFTMIVAAVVERKRMDSVKEDHLGEKLERNHRAHVSLTIFWLLPQYILAGAGEALTYAGQLDFFYNESPKAMRSMGSALCICTLSLGYYTSSLLVSLVNSATGKRHSDGSYRGAWLPDNVSTSGRLDKFYWLLAAASVGNFLLFLVCAHWYKYKALASQSKEFQDDASDNYDSADDCCYVTEIVDESALKQAWNEEDIDVQQITSLEMKTILAQAKLDLEQA